MRELRCFARRVASEWTDRGCAASCEACAVRWKKGIVGLGKKSEMVWEGGITKGYLFDIDNTRSLLMILSFQLCSSYLITIALLPEITHSLTRSIPPKTHSATRITMTSYPPPKSHFAAHQHPPSHLQKLHHPISSPNKQHLNLL